MHVYLCIYLWCCCLQQEGPGFKSQPETLSVYVLPVTVWVPPGSPVSSLSPARQVGSRCYGPGYFSTSQPVSAGIESRTLI